MVEGIEASERERPEAGARRTLLVRSGLALAGAALLAASFPPFDLGFATGWLAVAALALAVRGLRPTRAAMLGALFGFVAAQVVFHWMYRFDSFRVWHGVMLAGWVAVWPALFAIYLARWAFERRGLVIVPVAGAVIEWTRGHAGFLALPWMTFGQTQHRNLPLLQLASFGGELLVGMVVVLVGVALAQLVALRSARAAETRPALLALGVAGLLHLGGLARLTRAPTGEEMTVAAVQPAILPGTRTDATADAILARTAELTRGAVADGARLVVWPESSVGSLEGDLETKLAVRDVVQDTGVPIVLGSSHVEKMSDRGKGRPAKKPSNAAFVMVPHTPVAEPYKKVRLLPFAEYRPIDLPESIAPRMFDTERGGRHMTMKAGDVLVEPIICWENLFADEVRASASDEPTVLAHLINDAWFGPTAQAPLHNLASVVRAVENDRPVVVASNTGPSQIVDARGRVVARATAFFAPAFVTGRVHLPAGQTPYRRFGDWTWAVPSGLLLLALRLADRRRRRA